MKRTIILALIATLMLPLVSHAQLAGHNVAGDLGLTAGSQPPPGFYIMPSFFRYEADTLRDGNGDKIPPILPEGNAIESDALLFGFMWVSDFKILGGNFGASIWPSVTNNAIEFPAFPALNSKTSTGFGDLYVQPISLGWHTDRADFIAGLGIYAPTGEFDIAGTENRGLGMWSYEIYGGTTLYFDEAKSWHFAAVAAYETHGKKDGTDTRVGDLLTLEGGFGKSFMEGAASVGIAYYAQWKLTNDDFGLEFTLPGGPLLEKHERFAFGPEVTIPLATRNTLFGFLTLRYVWETGVVQSIEGDSFMATITFPVPSIPLQ